MKPSKKLKSKKNVLAIFLIIVFSQLTYPLIDKPIVSRHSSSWTTPHQTPIYMSNGTLETTAMRNSMALHPLNNEETLYCNTAEYVSANSYPNADTQVYYDCKIWKNQWYANPNEIPGDSNVWVIVSDCNEGPGCIPSFCNVSGYVSAYAYPNSNTEVYYNCKIWRNQWYVNPNEIPGENNVWVFLSDCTEDTDCLLSVTENEMSTIRISPNPSSDFIEITHIVTEKNYKIYDLNGQFIFDGTIGNNEKIDIRNINSGIYFIHFNDYSIKFIKK